MNNTQHGKTNELLSSNQHDEIKTHESELRQEEEYRASKPVFKPSDEMEDVNQEEEDPICNHDVLRGNGV